VRARQAPGRRRRGVGGPRRRAGTVWFGDGMVAAVVAAQGGGGKAASLGGGSAVWGRGRTGVEGWHGWGTPEWMPAVDCARLQQRAHGTGGVLLIDMLRGDRRMRRATRQAASISPDRCRPSHRPNLVREKTISRPDQKSRRASRARVFVLLAVNLRSQKSTDKLFVMKYFHIVRNPDWRETASVAIRRDGRAVVTAFQDWARLDRRAISRRDSAH
jgi:hypothetical protein